MKPLPRRSISVVVCFFLALAFTLAPFAATPFPHETSDLKPDPDTRFGTLPNGLRYALRANQTPKGRASLRLLVEAGSLHETSEQRGLAHFLEHLAFNGSTHYAPGTLIEFFQRMGMNFGGDTNASTSAERTQYLLELPDTAEATLAEGLRVLSDYAGGLLLKPEEIDKERGVILSEKRTRDSASYRNYLATQKFLLPGTLIPERPPIGVTEVLTKAQREQFASFYDTWYRPELISVIVVGDINVTAVEKQIVATFTPLTARAPARPAPDRGTVAPLAGVRAFHYFDAEATATTVKIALLTPHRREHDEKARRLEQLPRALAYAMINRRLSVLAKQEDAVVSGGSASTANGYDLYRDTSISVTCKPEQWAAALGLAEQEIRRALEHGFTAAELKEATRERLGGLNEAVRTASTRRSGALADGLAQSLLLRSVFTSPAADAELLKPALERVTPADCLTALRAVWAPKGRHVLVTGNAKLEGDASAAIAAAYEESLATEVSPPSAKADAPWAYTNFGPPGKIVHRERIADLDIVKVTFANGVRLNLKKTDFSVGRLTMSLRVGTGRLTEPASQPGLGIYAARTFMAGGLGKHSADELRRILAGRNTATSFDVGAEALLASSTTSRGGLLLKCQFLAAHLVDPGYRPESARLALKGIEQTYLGFEHTPGGPASLELARFISGGDHRFGYPPKAEMMQRNLDEVKAWLAPQLTRGALEIGIVGDIDLEAAIVAVGKTFGALPKRDPLPALDELRQVRFPAEPFVKNYTIATEIPKGTVSVYWPTTDGRDGQRALRLRLLADVFTDRLRIKVREELGDAYSPRAGSFTSDVYPGYGYISSVITIDPPKAKAVSDVVIALGEKLATDGITDDELERIKKPALTAIREGARNNGFWINPVSRAQERPDLVDRARTRESDVTAITAAELSALAKTYLRAARASRVSVLPTGKPAPARTE